MRKPFYGGMCSSFGGWHGCGLWWGISKMRSSSTSQICGFGKLHENHPMPCHGRSSFQRAFLPRRWRLRTSFGGLASYAMSAAAQRGAVWLVQDILSDAMTAMCPSPP
jgi:hypothetical protein